MIEMRGLGKRYWRLQEPAMLLQSMLPHGRPVREELWALRNLDLTVEPGETLGVLGRNGAGKTTLLRLLAGVTSPTEGSVRVVGRIAPLISLGVGFHNEMSGRENVLVNGMLLGLTAKQVAERFDSIVEFAELGEFIDTPVKFYSSGMFMRLGFAVVVHVDPTILLVDEILAVGDAGFQLKCFDRLRHLREQGAAIVVVSHSMHTVRRLCRRAILIRRGRLQYDGDVEGAIAAHESLFEQDHGASEGLGVVEFIDQRLIGGHGDGHHANYDDSLEFAVRLRFFERVEDPLIAFGAVTTTGLFGGYSTTQAGQAWRKFEPGDEAELRIAFAARMGAGSYRLVLDVRTRDGGRMLARTDDQLLTVVGRPGVSGLADVGARIKLDRASI
jgi:ABC-type polysaccharide/polyol phosphate transport system ATPase subunit